MNQTLPSGPRVMPAGMAPELKPGVLPPASSVIAVVAGHRRPSRPTFALAVNHSAPSPPSAMPAGPDPAVRPAA